MADELDRWRLVIDWSGPSVRGREMISAPTREELEPKIVGEVGHRFERYGTEEDYFEIRQDFITVRSLNPVPEPPPPAAEVGTTNEGGMTLERNRTRDS